MSVDKLKADYAALCATRDGINAEVAPLQAKLAEANARVQAAQGEANALAQQISHTRGGQKWIDLKKSIGLLAKALSGHLQA